MQVILILMRIVPCSGTAKGYILTTRIEYRARDRSQVDVGKLLRCMCFIFISGTVFEPEDTTTISTKNSFHPKCIFGSFAYYFVETDVKIRQTPKFSPHAMNENRRLRTRSSRRNLLLLQYRCVCEWNRKPDEPHWRNQSITNAWVLAYRPNNRNVSATCGNIGKSNIQSSLTSTFEEYYMHT